MHAATGPIILDRAPVRLAVAPEPSLPQSLIVRAVVSRNGRVARAQILRGPAVEGVAEAVVKLLQQWRFQPAEVEGEAVAVYMNLELPIAPLPEQQ